MVIFIGIAAAVAGALAVGGLLLVFRNPRSGQPGGVGGKVTDEFPRRGGDDYGERG